MALLGWSPRGELAEQEVFSLEELVAAFDLAGVSKSPAIFDIEKLTHFNALYLRAMEPADFARAAEPYIRQSVKDPALDAAEIAGLLQARCERLTDIPEKVDFFDALPDYDGALFTNKKSKTDPEVARAMLEAAIPALERLDGWTTEGIHDALIALAEKLAVKNATLMWPVRIAAAGKAVTPGARWRSATCWAGRRLCAACAWGWTSCDKIHLSPAACAAGDIFPETGKNRLFKAGPGWYNSGENTCPRQPGNHRMEESR